MAKQRNWLQRLRDGAEKLIKGVADTLRGGGDRQPKAKEVKRKPASQRNEPPPRLDIPPERIRPEVPPEPRPRGSTFERWKDRGGYTFRDDEGELQTFVLVDRSIDSVEPSLLRDTRYRYSGFSGAVGYAKDIPLPASSIFISRDPNDGQYFVIVDHPS